YSTKPNVTCVTLSADETFTVEEAVETIGFGRFHILLFIIMGSASIVEAMEIMLLAVVSPEIRCEWRLEDWQVALVSMMVFLGFMVCGVLSGYVADRYGRWKVVFGGFVWSAYFSLLTSFAPSYGWFIFLRSMVGCGIAGASQGFVLKTEFIPAKHRAYLLPLASIFWMLGSMLIIVLGMCVVPTLGWRWMIRISVTPSIILIFLFKVRTHLSATCLYSPVCYLSVSHLSVFTCLLPVCLSSVCIHLSVTCLLPVCLSPVCIHLSVFTCLLPVCLSPVCIHLSATCLSLTCLYSPVCYLFVSHLSVFTCLLPVCIHLSATCLSLTCLLPVCLSPVCIHLSATCLYLPVYIYLSVSHLSVFTTPVI
uniref:SVOP-like n=1 Tax=Labrus bergylta TaxID=56723 RepID=A0A3Q3FFU7_9LABR